MIYLSILCSILTLLMIFFLYLIFKYKKIIKSLNRKLRKIKFEDIYKETDEVLSILFENITTQNLVKEYVMSNDTLNTNKIQEFIKSTYLDFKIFINKDRYDLFNESLDNRYDELIIKLIYTKIIKFELEFKLIKKNNKRSV